MSSSIWAAIACVLLGLSNVISIILKNIWRRRAFEAEAELSRCRKTLDDLRDANRAKNDIIASLQADSARLKLQVRQMSER